MCLFNRKTQCAHNTQFALSNPKLLTKTETLNGSVPNHSGPWRNIAEMEELFSNNTGTSRPFTTGKITVFITLLMIIYGVHNLCLLSSALLLGEYTSFTSSIQKPRPKKKSQKDGLVRREVLKPGSKNPHSL